MKIRIIYDIDGNVTVSQNGTEILPVNGEYEVAPNTLTKIMVTTPTECFDNAEIFDPSDETVEWRL